MEKLTFLFAGVIFFLLTNMSFAQQEVNDCVNFYGAGNYQMAIQAGNTAIKLYPKNFIAYLCLGGSYHKVGEFDLAIKMLKKAEQLAGSKNDLSAVYNELGEVYERKGDLDKALMYDDRALTLNRELGDTSAEAADLDNIAGIYQLKGDLDKALNYYKKSLNLTTNERGKAPIYNNIATIYLERKNYQKSIEYFKKSVEIFERVGDYQGTAICTLNLGDAYRRAKNYNSALSYINEGLNRIKRVGDKYWEAAGYEYLGLYYRDTGNIKAAKEYLTKAYKLFSSTGANADAYEALFSLQALNNQKTK
ncbi:MAG: tetratricopeptide repeat protein [Candidatus Micrarchaeaceae archaeon]